MLYNSVKDILNHQWKSSDIGTCDKVCNMQSVHKVLLSKHIYSATIDIKALKWQVNYL